MMEVELQAMKMPSPTKAVAELERAHKMHEINAAIKALGEMQEMPPDVSARLLHLVQKFSMWDLHQNWEPDAAMQMAVVFGSKCGDPDPYAATLLKMLKAGGVTSILAAVAGTEIAARYRDATPGDVRNELLRWAMHASDSWTNFFMARRICVCRLYGFLGGAEHTGLLQNILNNTSLHEHRVAAEEALDLIRARTSREVAGALASQEFKYDGDVDTDPQLDEVLSESAREALLQHQQDLQETILRSKADCMNSVSLLEDAGSSTVPDNRLVLLCYQRRPREFFEALLTSPLAARVMAASGALQPKWAGGKLILAEGVTEASVSEVREDWHVAVRSADEGEIEATLRAVLGRQRPRVKASGGRVLVPQGTSLFQLSNSSSDGPGFAGDWADLVVIRRTFIDIPVGVLAAPRASASAPAEL
jgi:hypothetical protein